MDLVMSVNADTDLTKDNRQDNVTVDPIFSRILGYDNIPITMKCPEAWSIYGFEVW